MDVLPRTETQMNVITTLDPVDSRSAHWVAKTALRELAKGPQCPCGLAQRIRVQRKALYPYLAELIARGWISVYTPGELAARGEKRLHAPDRQDLLESNMLQEELDRTRSASATEFQGLPPSQRIEKRSILWYDFFRFLEHPSLSRLPIVFLIRTGLGSQIADQLG